MSGQPGGQPGRLAEGGRIDRERRLTFTFNGRPHTGYAGDTLASALLAADVRVVGRSFKYHRPRGIFSAGAEEPSAIVQIGEGARTVPDLRATQVELHDRLVASSVNCWPGPEFDIGAVNSLFDRLLPAGFYYKTFMWPASWWMGYEHAIRRAAGLGSAPTDPDPDRYERMNAHCDVLVVGAGPTGLAAAQAAARTGARVILAEQDSEPGGSLLGTAADIDGADALAWVAVAAADLADAGEVIVLPRTTVFGSYEHNFFAALERVTDHLGPQAPAHLPRQRLWRIRARQVVLATGAIERPLIFNGNDRPGVMLAGAARTYANRFAVKAGRRCVVFTNNDGAYAAALDLARAGVEVAAIVDLRPDPSGTLPTAAEATDIDVVGGHAVVAVDGGKKIKSVEVMSLNETGNGVRGTAQRIDCDLVCVSGGWNPVVHLHSHAGGKVRYDDRLAAFVPANSPIAIRSAGAAAGEFGLDRCLAGGVEAGIAAARDAGIAKGRKTVKVPAAAPLDENPARTLWVVPSRPGPGHGRKHFVDLQNDVTAADVALAAREGYRSVEHAKRYTTLGMGTDQGKTGNVHGLAILSQSLGQEIAETGTTTFRPPYTAVTFGAFAGRDVGDMIYPIRRSPMHHWHELVGAVFEDVGQWKRPWYYPRPGENMRAAVDRECLAARNAIGLVDATTLGKIDIRGRDAAEFLNRIYTNDWDTLKDGRCRYGLMLGEDGMVMDDGVTTRLARDHFLMSTTSGGAARVMGWLEEWLQTEWPALKVNLTSVTEAWAVASISGPQSRRLLADLAPDLDLDGKAFPFMSMRQGVVADIAGRVFRISFTGSLAYEVAVPASYGLALWTALMTAGEKYGITPYGTEAMHVLRAERGFIIAGQDTDGTVTPVDLGLEWMMSQRKDYLGRRSLSRADTARADRKQLVGLLTEDPTVVLPEGAQVVSELRRGGSVSMAGHMTTRSRSARVVMPMIGHVTSSYHSANCGRSIALALVERGRDRIGETLDVPLVEKDIRVRVTEPRFLDDDGVPLHG